MPQLLPVLHEPVLAVPAPHDEARVGGVEAVAQAHGLRGDADGEVLGVPLAVVAPEGQDDESGDDEDGEGDGGRYEQRLCLPC